MDVRRSSRLKLAVNECGKQRLSRFIRRNLELIESTVCIKKSNSLNASSLSRNSRGSEENTRCSGRAESSTRTAKKPKKISTSSPKIPDLAKGNMKDSKGARETSKARGTANSNKGKSTLHEPPILAITKIPDTANRNSKCTKGTREATKTTAKANFKERKLTLSEPPISTAITKLPDPANRAALRSRSQKKAECSKKESDGKKKPDSAEIAMRTTPDKSTNTTNLVKRSPSSLAGWAWGASSYSPNGLMMMSLHRKRSPPMPNQLVSTDSSTRTLKRPIHMARGLQSVNSNTRSAYSAKRPTRSASSSKIQNHTARGPNQLDSPMKKTSSAEVSTTCLNSKTRNVIAPSTVHKSSSPIASTDSDNSSIPRAIPPSITAGLAPSSEHPYEKALSPMQSDSNDLCSESSPFSPNPEPNLASGGQLFNESNFSNGFPKKPNSVISISDSDSSAGRADDSLLEPEDAPAHYQSLRGSDDGRKLDFAHVKPGGSLKHDSDVSDVSLKSLPRVSGPLSGFRDGGQLDPSDVQSLAPESKPAVFTKHLSESSRDRLYSWLGISGPLIGFGDGRKLDPSDVKSLASEPTSVGSPKHPSNLPGDRLNSFRKDSGAPLGSLPQSGSAKPQRSPRKHQSDSDLRKSPSKNSAVGEEDLALESLKRTMVELCAGEGSMKSLPFIHRNWSEKCNNEPNQLSNPQIKEQTDEQSTDFMSLIDYKHDRYYVQCQLNEIECETMNCVALRLNWTRDQELTQDTKYVIVKQESFIEDIDGIPENVLRANASEAAVLLFGYVQECAVEEKLVKIQKHHIPKHKGTWRKMFARYSLIPTLADFAFYITPEITDSGRHARDVVLLRNLLQLTRSKLCSSLDELRKSPEGRKVALRSTAISDSNDVTFVHYHWLYDCVVDYRLHSLESYACDFTVY